MQNLLGNSLSIFVNIFSMKVVELMNKILFAEMKMYSQVSES